MVSELSSDSEECRRSSRNLHHPHTEAYTHARAYTHSHTQLSHQTFWPLWSMTCQQLGTLLSLSRLPNAPLARGRASGEPGALPGSPHPCPAQSLCSDPPAALSHLRPAPVHVHTLGAPVYVNINREEGEGGGGGGGEDRGKGGEGREERGGERGDSVIQVSKVPFIPLGLREGVKGTSFWWANLLDTCLPSSLVCSFKMPVSCPMWDSSFIQAYINPIYVVRNVHYILYIRSFYI